MGQQPVPELGLGLRDNLVRLRQLLNVVDTGHEGIGVGLRGADPQHVQDHLRVLRIILVPTVVQRFSGPSQGNRGDEAQRESRLEQAECERPVIVARRLEGSDHGPADLPQEIDEAIVLGAGVQHGQSSAAKLARRFNQDVVAQLRHIYGYQNSIWRRRLSVGHGRASSKVQNRHLHFRDLRPGPDRLPAWRAPQALKGLRPNSS